LLNRVQYPSDVIARVVLWRLRYKLSLRDLAEMVLTRGFIFSCEAARDWEAKLTPTLAENLRRRRRGRVGPSWYDVMFSEHRELAAARVFLRSAKAVTGVTPDRVTTDGHDAYPRAIRTELGKHVRHRTIRHRSRRFSCAFMERFAETLSGVVAIDGKTLRRSFDRAVPRKSPLHMVHAWAAS
jgi:putative transposase